MTVQVNHTLFDFHNSTIITHSRGNSAQPPLAPPLHITGQQKKDAVADVVEKVKSNRGAESLSTETYNVLTNFFPTEDIKNFSANDLKRIIKKSDKKAYQQVKAYAKNRNRIPTAKDVGLEPTESKSGGGGLGTFLALGCMGGAAYLAVNLGEDAKKKLAPSGDNQAPAYMNPEMPGYPGMMPMGEMPGYGGAAMAA